MSTKTTFKRVALVAVASLGFGVLGSVTANAAAGDVTAITATATASATQITVTGSATIVTGLYADGPATAAGLLTDNVIGLVVVASPDPDLTVGTTIYSTVAGLVTVTTTGASATAGAKIFTFATKVSPNAGLYQFRVFGTTVLAAGLGATPAAVANVNYNPPSLTATELKASTDATVNIRRVKSVALAVAYPSSRVGTKVSITPSYLAETNGTGNLVADAELATLVYILTKPTGSASVLSASTAAILQTSTNTAVTATVVPALASSTGTAVTYTPDIAGTYTLTAFHDAGGAAADGVLTTGEASASISVAVAADAPVITLTTFGASSTTGGVGALVRVNLTNGGVAGSLGASEYFTISATNTGAITGGTTTLTQASFDAYGRAFFNVTNANAATSTISVIGAGSTAIAALSATTSVKYVAATAVGTTAATYTTKTANTVAAYAGTALAVVGGNNLYYDKAKAMSASITGTTTLVADSIVSYKVTDGTAGCLTGKASSAYDVAATVGSALTFSVAAAGMLTTHVPCVTAVAAAVKGTAVAVGTILVTDSGADTFTLNASPSLVTTVTNVPTTYTQVIGSVVAGSSNVRDQFYAVKSGVAVTVTASAASRNYGAFTTKNLVTDASGNVSWTYTDAPLTANSSLKTDAFTVASTLAAANAGGVATDGGLYADTVVTVTTVAATTATKVSVTGGDTTAGVTATAVTLVDINAGSTGAQAGGVTFSAKVTDVNGAVVVGAPVTWTVSGTGAAIKTNYATTYTDSTGVATATTAVYGWIAGQYTVTATSGAITGTGSITFANIATGEERKITSSVTGSVVTAKVVDRFGNPVFGTLVYATKSGLGTFVTGLGLNSATTNQAGIAQFAIVGGSADVIVSLINPASAAGAKGSGQSSARAGAFSWNDDAADDTLFATAVLAGTIFTAEAGVGSTFADAGVATAAAVSVVGDTSAVDAATAAVDAAAEATDAANAATDAANAAAEAADAATAAAQDAADAVAALSTQVSEMVNALKKQITALTNLVIKIQKKVKA
jgi:hypothetical protein